MGLLEELTQQVAMYLYIIRLEPDSVSARFVVVLHQIKARLVQFGFKFVRFWQADPEPYVVLQRLDYHEVIGAAVLRLLRVFRRVLRVARFEGSRHPKRRRRKGWWRRRDRCPDARPILADRRCLAAAG